jgi:hypothetical protein
MARRENSSAEHLATAALFVVYTCSYVALGVFGPPTTKTCQPYKTRLQVEKLLRAHRCRSSAELLREAAAAAQRLEQWESMEGKQVGRAPTCACTRDGRVPAFRQVGELRACVPQTRAAASAASAAASTPFPHAPQSPHKRTHPTALLSRAAHAQDEWAGWLGAVRVAALADALELSARRRHHPSAPHPTQRHPLNTPTLA